MKEARSWLDQSIVDDLRIEPKWLHELRERRQRERAWMRVGQGEKTQRVELPRAVWETIWDYLEAEIMRYRIVMLRKVMLSEETDT